MPWVDASARSSSEGGMDGTVIGKGDRPDAPVRASDASKLCETMDEMLEPLTRQLSGA